jgi:hypothetical protein
LISNPSITKKKKKDLRKDRETEKAPSDLYGIGRPPKCTENSILTSLSAAENSGFRITVSTLLSN